MTDRKQDDDHFRETEALQRKMLKLNQDTILFIQSIHSTESSQKEALKIFNKSSTPSFYYFYASHLLYMMREVILTSEFFFQKRHLREVNCAQDQLHFSSSAYFFSLTPKNPNDHHLHQHSQTPNNLPIVWCLTNNLLTSWSLIPILNLNSSKKITSINVLPHHLNQSAPSKFNFFFLSDQPIWQQNSSPNPSNSHQSSNSNLNSSFPSSTLLLLCILVALLLHGITP